MVEEMEMESRWRSARRKCGRRVVTMGDVMKKKKSKGRDLSLWCPVRPFVQQACSKPGRRWA